MGVPEIDHWGGIKLHDTENFIMLIFGNSLDVIKSTLCDSAGDFFAKHFSKSVSLQASALNKSNIFPLQN